MTKKIEDYRKELQELPIEKKIENLMGRLFEHINGLYCELFNSKNFDKKQLKFIKMKIDTLIETIKFDAQVTKLYNERRNPYG